MVFLYKKTAFVGLYRPGRGQCCGAAVSEPDFEHVHPDARDPRTGVDTGHDPQRHVDFSLARQLCTAQRPACRQRRAVHDGRCHGLDAGLAHGPELGALRADGHGCRRRLVRHGR